LCCSTASRSNTAAFVSAYVWTLAFYLGPVLLCIWSWSWLDNPELSLTLNPFYWYTECSLADFGQMFVASSLLLGSTVFFLAFAWATYTPLRPVRRPSLILRLWRAVDRFMSNANKRFGNIMVIRDRHALPDNDPVAWREVNKRSLGRARYLCRMGLVLGVPVLIVILVFSLKPTFNWRGESQLLSATVFVYWLLAVLLIVVASANAVAAERSRATMDVLLTTPLTGQEIVQQKMKGVWLMCWLLTAPLILLCLFEGFWEAATNRHQDELAGYLAASLLAIAIYLPMCAWVSMAIGMRLKSGTRAVTTALTVLVLYNAGTVLLVVTLHLFLRINFEEDLLRAVCPAAIVVFAETNVDELWDDGAPWVLVNFIWHAVAMLWCRALCYRNADKYLGRVSGPQFDDGPVDRTDPPELPGIRTGAFGP